MYIVNLENLSNDELKKRLAFQIKLKIWQMSVVNVDIQDYYTKEQELQNILKENWKDYWKRVKPILKILKEEFRKEVEQGILLDGLTKLINSNTENISHFV